METLGPAMRRELCEGFSRLGERGFADEQSERDLRIEFRALETFRETGHQLFDLVTHLAVVHGKQCQGGLARTQPQHALKGVARKGAQTPGPAPLPTTDPKSEQARGPNPTTAREERSLALASA
jgi:hypothetical protein